MFHPWCTLGEPSQKEITCGSRYLNIKDIKVVGSALETQKRRGLVVEIDLVFPIFFFSLNKSHFESTEKINHGLAVSRTQTYLLPRSQSLQFLPKTLCLLCSFHCHHQRTTQEERRTPAKEASAAPEDWYRQRRQEPRMESRV